MNCPTCGCTKLGNEFCSDGFHNLLELPPVRPIGAVVKPWGRIDAVGRIGGERYYWLVDKAGTVSMMPADVVERASDDSDSAHADQA